MISPGEGFLALKTLFATFPHSIFLSVTGFAGGGGEDEEEDEDEEDVEGEALL